MPSSRMPGVSITAAPSGSISSSLWVVVWRPLSSFLRPPVSCLSSPSSRLMRVDLPTPEEPTKATVFPWEI